MAKEKRSCKSEVRYTPDEFRIISDAAEKFNMKMSVYIREKSLKEDGSLIVNENMKLVEKTGIGIWYVDMIDTINLVENGAVKKELFLKMRDLECLLLK